GHYRIAAKRNHFSHAVGLGRGFESALRAELRHTIQFDLSAQSDHGVFLQGHLGTRRGAAAGSGRRRERQEYLRSRGARTAGYLQSDAALGVSRGASRAKWRGVGDRARHNFPEGLDQFAAAAGPVSGREMRIPFMNKYGPAKAGHYVLTLLLVVLTSGAA